MSGVLRDCIFCGMPKIMGLQIDIISKNKIKFYVSLRDENTNPIANITNMFRNES